MLRSPFYLLAILGGFIALDFAAGTLAGRVVLGGDRADSVTRAGDRVENAFAALIGNPRANGDTEPREPDMNCEALRSVVAATNGELPRECIAGEGSAPDFSAIASDLPEGIHVVAMRSRAIENGYNDRVYAVRKTGRTLEVLFSAPATTDPEPRDEVYKDFQPYGGKAFVAPGQYDFKKNGQRRALMAIGEPTPQQRGNMSIIFDTNGNNRPDSGDTVGTDAGLGVFALHSPLVNGNPDDVTATGCIALKTIEDSTTLLNLLPEEFKLLVVNEGAV